MTSRIHQWAYAILYECRSIIFFLFVFTCGANNSYVAYYSLPQGTICKYIFILCVILYSPHAIYASVLQLLAAGVAHAEQFLLIDFGDPHFVLRAHLADAFAAEQVQ